MRWLVLSLWCIWCGGLAAAQPLKLVCFGDSLTAGFGLDKAEAFPAILAEQLADAGIAIEVINAGISGDTSAGGRSRITWTLNQHQPTHLLLALGANDGLRGFPPAITKENLSAIIAQAQDAGVVVLLAGMVMPPSHGATYAAEYTAIFPELAEEFSVPLYPFLLDGVGGEPDLNQADGVHPNAAGQARIAKRLGAWLLPHLSRGRSDQ